MIAEIRSCFKAGITEVDPSLRQHNEYFTSENIADTKIEDTYFLQIGDLATSLIDTNFQGIFEVTLELWKNGKNDVINRLDAAYCDAIEIMSKIQDQSTIDQTEFLKKVEGSAILPAASEDNDNLGKFTLQFRVTTGYKSV